MPIFNLKLANDSKIGNFILDNTPILSSLADDTVEVYSDVWKIIENRDNKSNKEINTLVLATLLDNNLITVESAKKLVLTNKISITDESILDNYEDDGDLYDKLKEKYYEVKEEVSDQIEEKDNND